VTEPAILNQIPLKSLPTQSFPNRELGEEFCVNQMHLPQVRLRRISADTGEMLNGPPRMCVPLDAVTNAEADARECRFAERVTITPTDRVNYSVHLRRPD
jgi:hypothetical protein